MPRTIAIVEDEDAIAQNYCDALRRQGYKVNHYRSRPEALSAFNNRLPDLAIIDIGLGDDIEGGFELCRELRSRAPELPIIFLTARDSEFDVVSGLRLGADDYLTKDISLVHMMARITALFRRIDTLQNPTNTEKEISRDKLTVNMDRMNVRWEGSPIDLTITELWIVHALAQFPGHVKNRQQLMDAANVVLDDNTITSHVKRIRKKFKEVDAGFDCIQTAYGMGYRWVTTDAH
ncbi:MAG: two-component system OmpR family response regulator [Flavobacteriales bacterium]|jgi:two-component system OmpR family response regulator